MRSFTVKLPAVLDKKLRTAVRKRGEKISSLMRRALEKEVAEDAPDFGKLASRYKGMFCEPRDLSTR